MHILQYLYIYIYCMQRHETPQMPGEKKYIYIHIYIY